MIVPLTHFATSSSGIGALGINVQGLIIQLVTFLLAFWALEHWAFKPILKLLERRRDTIERGLRFAEQMQKEKSDLDQQVAQALHEARLEADNILSDAHEASRQTIQDAEDAARKKVEGIMAASEERIKQDTARARGALRQELSGLVSEATEALIHEKVDAKKDASLIDEALKGGSRA